jgi:two-component system LytT family sensor kinase
MINPITGNRVYFLAYLLVWIIFALIQTSIEFFMFNTSLVFAITDSLIYNFLFFILGISMWFPVRYMSFSEKKVFVAVLSHMLLGASMLFLWIFSGYLLLKGFIGGDTDSLVFLDASMPFRSVIGGLFFILMIMLYYLMVYSENLKQKINDEANLKTLVREAELSALKAQINPHFLFNSLNSVSSLTIRDPSKARRMIIELSEFLRYSLKFNEKEETSLNEEIQNIRRYLEIEKIRFENRLVFEMEIAEDCKMQRLPNMILQPLFENAIKHGVYESLETITIKFKCEIISGFLVLTISNNYDKTHLGKTGAGIGLKNIGSRLKLIYGKDNLLSVSGNDGIFTVILKIPVK